MRYAVVLVVCALALTACCEAEKNRKSKEAMLQVAGVLEAESAFIADLQLDPVTLAMSPDGVFDQAKCIEYAKMFEVVAFDNLALAEALRKWVAGEDVTDYVPPVSKAAERCTVPVEPLPAPEGEVF